jgi:hypothetical protein
MEVTISYTILAYLLALRDFSDILTDQEKESLKKVAKDLNLRREALKSHIEPFLIQATQGNSRLYQSYQYYKERLDSLEQIPTDLLPQYAEVKSLVTNQHNLILRGFDDNSLPTGFEQQIENAIIVVGQSETPEQTVKKISSLDKLKQFLGKRI